MTQAKPEVKPLPALISINEPTTGVVNTNELQGDGIFDTAWDPDPPETGEGEYPDYDPVTEIAGDWKMDLDGKWFPFDGPAGFAVKINCDSGTTQIIQSEYILDSARCSPCYPGQGDLANDGTIPSFSLAPGQYREDYERKDQIKPLYLEFFNGEKYRYSLGYCVAEPGSEDDLFAYIFMGPNLPDSLARVKVIDKSDNRVLYIDLHWKGSVRQLCYMNKEGDYISTSEVGVGTTSDFVPSLADFRYLYKRQLAEGKTFIRTLETPKVFMKVTTPTGAEVPAPVPYKCYSIASLKAFWDTMVEVLEAGLADQLFSA